MVDWESALICASDKMTPLARDLGLERFRVKCLQSIGNVIWKSL